jgi:hypothetical protein
MTVIDHLKYPRVDLNYLVKALDKWPLTKAAYTIITMLGELDRPQQ